MIGVKLFGHAEQIPLKKILSSFPNQVGEWLGKQEYFDKQIYDSLGVDDAFLGNYTTPDGRLIQLYIGYYETQREGHLIHSPKHCLPGAGWNILSRSIEEIIIPKTNPGKLRAVKLFVEKGGQRQSVLYWFQSGKRFIASEYMQKIYLVVDAITRKRTDGAFVRVMSPLKDESIEETVSYLKDFAKTLLPILKEYIPS